MRRQGWYSIGMATIVTVIATAMIAFSFVGCGAAGNADDGVIKIGEADQGRTLAVEVGGTIEVSLAGNPTTGYVWAAALDDKDAAFFEQVGEPAYVQGSAEDGVVGAGGTYTFTFKPVAKGKATLTLVYERPWESVTPLQTYQVTLVIK